jgi:hypothetical protein
MEPSIFVISGREAEGLVAALRIESHQEFNTIAPITLNRKQWLESDGRVVFSHSAAAFTLANTIVKASICLSDNFDVSSGLQSYEKGRGIPPQTPTDVKNHVFDREKWEDENSYRYLQGQDVDY